MKFVRATTVKDVVMYINVEKIVAIEVEFTAGAGTLIRTDDHIFVVKESASDILNKV